MRTPSGLVMANDLLALRECAANPGDMFVALLLRCSRCSNDLSLVVQPVRSLGGCRYSRAGAGPRRVCSAAAVMRHLTYCCDGDAIHVRVPLTLQ